MHSNQQPSRRAFSSLALAFSAAALFALAASAPAQAVPAATTMNPITMPVPQVLSGATVVSRLTASKVLNMSLSLVPNRAALKEYARQVNDPRSPNYHRFLTPKQVGERFGASANTVNTAVAYLKGKGMTITMIGDSHMTILFKGTVAKVETAFSTKLNNYKVASRPTRGPLAFFSYATTPKVPATFASKVVAIGGLDNANPPVPMTTFLTPSQSRGLYGVRGLYDAGLRGEGVTVAITNLGDGYRISNLSLFYSTFGLPAPAGGVGSNVARVAVGTVDGNTQDEGGESNLDIQMVLAQAPLCNVIVYDGFDAGFVSILAREYQDDKADILTESWGVIAGDSSLEAAADIHASMSVSGMTYLASSGDSGTSEGGFYYPHCDPSVLAIGGTDATVSDANGTRVSENGWDGSGSGWNPSDTLSFNHLPAYQVGNGVPTDIDKRLYPDVGLHATGSQFVNQGALGAVGGTSSSSPQFAGQLALVLQKLKANGAADSYTGDSGVTHSRLGQIHSLIYGLNGASTAFYDVTNGDTGVLPNGDEAVGGTGWDFVTGWGAPIGSGLYDAIYLNGSEPVVSTSDSQNIYTAARPTLQLGTLVATDGNDLAEAGDGQAMTVQSVRQSGVGQVAAVEVGFTLTNANRRSASFTAAFSTPKLTTGFLYLFNYTTNVYDVVATVPGDGTTKTTTLGLELDKYIDASGHVQALVRALKPTRLGNVPFTVNIDQAIVTERVPRSNSTGS